MSKLKLACVAVSSKDELFAAVAETVLKFVDPMVATMLAFSPDMLVSSVERSCVRPCHTLPSPVAAPLMTKLLSLLSTCLSL